MNLTGKDVILTAENVETIAPSLILMNPRNYRIPNSKTESHMVPIQTQEGGTVCFISKPFTAPGIFVQHRSFQQGNTQAIQNAMSMNAPATTDEQKPNAATPSLMLTKDLADGIFSPFYEKIMDALYPQLLRQIKKFADVEAAHNRSLNPFMQKLLTDGAAGRNTHMRSFWSDKEVAYIKIMWDALLYSRPQKEALIESSTVSHLNQHALLPRRGRYQIRVQLRYLYLGPSQNNMHVHLNMKIDQIFYEPDEITAPTEAVMDLDSFFEPPPRPLTGDEILAQAIEAAGLPPAPRAPQKPPKRKVPQGPPAQPRPLAPKPPHVAGKPASYKQQTLGLVIANKKPPTKKPKRLDAPAEGEDDSLEFLDMM